VKPLRGCSELQFEQPPPVEPTALKDFEQVRHLTLVVS